MKSVNSKLKALSAIVAVGMMAMAGAASAQTVVGGGATLPQPLYKDIFSASPALVLGTWSYTGTGSGAGKKAFLTNNPQATVGGEFHDETTAARPIWPTSQTVHFAGSDSALSSTELTTYNAAYNNGSSSTVANYGRLIQVPAVATPVLLPYQETGVTALNLSTEQICKIYSLDANTQTWDKVAPGVGSTSPIQVVYRSETSGTTELLSRFLSASCSTFLPAGKSFTISNSFKTVVASALPTLTATNADGLPQAWVAATGSDGVNTAAKAIHRLAYLSPDFDFHGNDNSRVARVNGFQPDAASIQSAIDLSAPPTGLARNTATNWVPAYVPTSTAYPIYGTTNLLLGQCYAAGVGTGTAGAAVKDFLTKLNNGTYDAKITADNFVKLPTAWNNAINAAFLTSTSSLALGNTSVCNGIGRP